MKANVLIALTAYAALTLACSGAPPRASGGAAAAQAPPPQPTPSQPREPSQTNLAEYRELLFVDETLEELTSPTRVNPLPAKGPFEGFARAGAAVRAGRAAEAKKHLRAAMEHPKAEVRMRLWAWNALRELGERPPPDIAREVHGVVLEIPVDDWLDTLAVYSDGRVRYVNGKSGAIIWEDTGPSDIHTLAAEVVRAAGPLVGKARPVGKHLPMSMSVTRVTLLTYSGMYVAEGDMDYPSGDVGAVFRAAERLFLTLLEKRKEQERGAPPAGEDE